MSLSFLTAEQGKLGTTRRLAEYEPHLLSLPLLPVLSSAKSTAPAHICSLPPQLVPFCNLSTASRGSQPRSPYVRRLGGASPPSVSSLGRGKGKINLCLCEPHTYVSFSLREFALLFNLFSLLALEADDAVCREVPALHSPPPPGIFLSLVVLGIHPMFLRKKRGPQDKYAFNKQ